MPLYLLRHGETEFNVVGRFQGQYDSPLTELGIRQAQSNGDKLAQIIVNKKELRLISSPLHRALKTSQVISDKLGISRHQIETNEKLSEIHLGTWQGMTKQEIKQQFPKEWMKRCQNIASYKINGGGENYNAVIARVNTWLNQTCDKWERDEDWVVVSHGVTGCVVRGQYLGLDIHATRALSRNHDWFYEIGQGQVITHKSTPANKPI